MTDGELKKRIEKELFNPIAWKGKAQAIWDFELFKILDEAKKDFPSHADAIKWAKEHNSIPSIQYWNMKMYDWFMKWFGT